jgi:hypothetical protein
VELQEQTVGILETPVGQLYASQASKEGRDAAYDIAYDTIQLVEYLHLGHARSIPGSLYSPKEGASEALENPVEAMQQLLQRMQAEGDMYMELRNAKLMADLPPDDEREDPSESEDDSSSSSDDEDDEDKDGDSGSDEDESSSSDEEDEKGNQGSDGKRRGSGSVFSQDFAPPGPTAKLYEALLDGMACVGGGVEEPMEYYDLAEKMLHANDLDQGNNVHTLPTLVTYNAALRGIAQCEYSTEPLRDDALSSAFGLYNHLTHSLHLPRNAMTIVYMLQVVNQALPASRVKGNISVSFWQHASDLGLVTDDVIKAVQQVHEPLNGPEFGVFLERISGDLPQKQRRFVNKYKHSDHY